MQQSGDRQDRWGWMLALGLVVAVVVFCYPLLLGIPLLDPDEGLHAAVAQEMVEGGDWLTPRFLGRPFRDKPVLYFWVQAASLRLFGMGQAAVRLPGLIFGLLGAVTTGMVGWRMFGRGVGLTSGVFYASMVLPAALAQAAAHDVALVPWVNMALLLLWESDRVGGWTARLKYVPAIGLLLGLACLTKGLVGVVLVGVAYGCYLLVCRRLTAAACIQGAAALALGALIASAWYIPVELADRGYLYYYFVKRHVSGFATGGQAHGLAEWWYYLPVLLGGGLPWVVFLPVTALDAWLHRGRAGEGSSDERPAGHPTEVPAASGQSDGSRGAMVLLWCWAIGCTLFLSVSHSKLVTYIWPVFPAVAVLAAVAWVRLLQGRLARPARRLALVTYWVLCLVGVAVAPGAMLVAESEFGLRFGWPVWTVTVLGGLSTWVALGFLALGRLRATLTAGILSLAALYLLLMGLVFPLVAAQTSARELAGYFNRQGRVPPRVVILEERLGSLVFYLEPQLRAGLDEGQLLGVPMYCLGEQFPLPSGSVVALPERHVSQAAGSVELGGVPYRRAGRYRVYDASRLDERW